QEPGDSSPRDARRIGSILAPDPCGDLLGHAVQGMDDTRASEPAGEAAEEPCAAVVRVDDVGSLHGWPERGGALKVELVLDRDRLRGDVEAAEALGQLLAAAEHADVDALGGDSRDELSQVREGPAALDRRDVDDPHNVACSARRRPSSQIALASPPRSQKGRKYCSER